MKSVGDSKVEGYTPGVIGEITYIHGVYYHQNWGFDISFETQVAKELSDFMIEYQLGRDGLWVARMTREFAGSIVIDGRNAELLGLRVRWFIVPPAYQGAGIGRMLLGKAVNFCRESGYKKVYLWTFQGLRAARKLYLDKGFQLKEEHQVNQWGRNINEQMYELIIS
ncbi:MAG: GNAT family N-acetyltransferase [Spirochaetota bacterium]